MDSTVTADRRVSDEAQEADDEDADDDALMTPRAAVRDDDGWNAETATEPDDEASAAKRQRRFMVNSFEIVVVGSSKEYSLVGTRRCGWVAMTLPMFVLEPRDPALEIVRGGRRGGDDNREPN